MARDGSATAAAPSAALGLAIFAVIPIAASLYARQQRKRDEERRRAASRHRSSVYEEFRGKKYLRPPFPPAVKDMLTRCRLAYLSTVDVDQSSSHLSLMRYTYIPEEEVIVMSTNTKTKKFTMLEKQTGVALLVHDFAQFGDDDDNGGGNSGAGGGEQQTYSITLNGMCHIVGTGPDAERYRAAHLKANPQYPQFIVGEDIAMLCVDVQQARICDIHDRVTKWNVNDGVEGSRGSKLS